MIANPMAHCESNTSRFYSVHSTQWPMPFEQTAQQWCRSRVQHHTQPAFACNKLGEVETEMVRVTHAHPPQGLDEMGKPQGPPAREGGKEGGRASNSLRHRSRSMHTHCAPFSVNIARIAATVSVRLHLRAWRRSFVGHNHEMLGTITKRT